MSIRAFRGFATLVVGVGAAVAVAVSPATAAEPSETTTTISEAPMVLVGYDKDVAAAHGYKIVTAADGTQTSVPVTLEAKRAEARAQRPTGGLSVAPYATVVKGDCGSSRIVIGDAPGTRKATISTSFALNRPAVSYRWNVDIAGPRGVLHRTFGGLLLSTAYWQHTFDQTVPVAGATYIAAVTTGSFAILNNGGVCYSGGPSDAEWID